MLRHLFAIFAFCNFVTTATPVAANKSDFDHASSESDNAFTIQFDDFPDNSIPDFNFLDEPDIVPKKLKFDSGPDAEKAIDKQSEFGIVNYDFPCAMVNGVNVLTGEYQESPTDFELPGTLPLTLQRHYNSGPCKKRSLHYGWRLSHGAKLFTHQKNHFRAFVIGSERHGILFKGDSEYQSPFSCPDSFFAKNVTNCALGEISANNNFKNDRLYKSLDTFQLCTARHHHYWFTKSSHDPERIHNSHTHGYRLDKIERPDGSSYKYIYSQSFGMPTSITLLNRQGSEAANLKLEKSPSQTQFLNNPELHYLTSTGEKIKYRFKLYKSNERAILSEVEAPHAPKIKYRYLIENGHEKKQRLWKRELPDNRVLTIDYNHKGKVRNLFSPAGEGNQTVATHNFAYEKSGDDRSVIVTNGLQGVKKYFWRTSSKRLDAIITYEDDRPIFKERFYWGDSQNNKSHLRARLLKEGNGELVALQTYTYDSFGNILELSFWGNLTGRDAEPNFITENEDHFHFQRPCDFLRTTYTYDAKKRRQTENTKRLLNEYKYLGDTDLVSAHYTSYNGRIQIRRFYKYDASGAVSSEIEDDGSAKSAKDLTQVTERRIKTIQNTKLGLPEIIEEDALNLETGQMESIRKTVNAYDQHGWLKFQSVYGCDGDLAYTLEWDHDKHGNVIYEKDALGNVTESRYDANDNLILEHKPDLAPRTLKYDHMNRLIGDTLEASKKESLHKSYQYDAMGNCVSSQDIYGKTTFYKYDAHSRLIKITYPSLHHSKVRPTQTYTRNGQGLATSIIDAKAHTTRIAYNVRGKPLSIIFPDGTIEQRKYTLWGELAECTARDGTKIKYTYDPQGRETSKTWLDAKGKLKKTTTKEYDAFHLRVETDGRGTQTRYAYDPAGRLKSKKVKNRLIEYAYDNLGKLKTTTHHLKDNTTVSYVEERDALDRILESYTICPDGTEIDHVSRRYDAQGNEIEMHGAQSSRCRDDYYAL